MRLYAIVLEERNGKYEYIYDKLVTAYNQEDAEAQASRLARDWYDQDTVEVNGDTFYHNRGEVALRVKGVEKTTKKAWTEQQYQRAIF